MDGLNGGNAGGQVGVMTAAGGGFSAKPQVVTKKGGYRDPYREYV